jgi:hypothetical protein
MNIVEVVAFVFVVVVGAVLWHTTREYESRMRKRLTLQLRGALAKATTHEHLLRAFAMHGRHEFMVELKTTQHIPPKELALFAIEIAMRMDPRLR